MTRMRRLYCPMFAGAARDACGARGFFAGERWISCMIIWVGDTTMYQQQWRYTKTQIKDELVSWRQILNDPDSAEESKDQAKEKIAELEEGYDSAPDSASMAPADATIGTQQEIDFQTGKVKAEYNGVDIAEIPGLGINKGKAFSVHNNTKDGEIIVEENVGGWEVTDTASQGARLYYTDYDLTPENMCLCTGGKGNA